MISRQKKYILRYFRCSHAAVDTGFSALAGSSRFGIALISYFNAKHS